MKSIIQNERNTSQKGRRIVRKTYTISSSTLENTHINFLLENQAENIMGTPSGKLITDSDAMTFVYMMDEEEGYSYVEFPQAIWPDLAAAMQVNAVPVLKWDAGKVELVHLWDELRSLIYNIEGNSNYGEAFTTAVEEVFAQLLSEA